MAEPVGIMGGTFDPVHFGHLVAAEEARVRFHLSRVVFVPNGEPPHKKEYPVTPAKHRYEMVLLATASNPDFETSRIEIDRPGPSYAVDTVRAFRRELGPEVGIYFITGADAILEILTWRDPDQLARNCEFIAVTRPGHDIRRLQESLSESLQARVHILDVPGVDISSTALRRRAASGGSLRYLTPQPVVRYIAATRLYGAPSPAGESPVSSCPVRGRETSPANGVHRAPGGGEKAWA
jgi:nicotinate-nucleotide adenylyltransferase